MTEASTKARVGQLKFVTRIGVGSRGQIFKAEASNNGQIVAVKVMNIDDEETRTEVAALTKVQPHPHIISLLGSVEYSADSAFLVMEYAETDLLELIMASGGLPEAKCQRYFSHLVKAVKHCHLKKVYHGDLKPENALILKGDVLKLCDFGSATFSSRTSKAAGSIFYAAPEVLPLLNQHDATPLAPGAHAVSLTLGDGSPRPDRRGPRTYDAAAADVWSLGVLLFVMLAGRPPFSEASLYDAEFVKLANHTFSYPPEFPSQVVDLLQHILVIQPKRRYTVRQVARHAWVKPKDQSKDSELQQKKASHSSRRKRTTSGSKPQGIHHHLHVGPYHSKTEALNSAPVPERQAGDQHSDTASTGSQHSSQSSASSHRGAELTQPESSIVTRDSTTHTTSTANDSYTITTTATPSTVSRPDSMTDVLTGLPKLRINSTHKEPTIDFTFPNNPSILHDESVDIGMDSTFGETSAISAPLDASNRPTPFGLTIRSTRPPSTVDDSEFSASATSDFGIMPLPALRIASRPSSAASGVSANSGRASSNFQGLTLAPRLQHDNSLNNSSTSLDVADKDDVMNGFDIPTQSAAIRAFQVRQRLLLTQAASEENNTPKSDVTSTPVSDRMRTDSAPLLSDSDADATLSPGLSIRVPGSLVAAAKPGMRMQLPAAFIDATGTTTAMQAPPERQTSDDKPVIAAVHAQSQPQSTASSVVGVADGTSTVTGASTPRLERSPPLAVSAALLRHASDVATAVPRHAAISRATMARLGQTFFTGKENLSTSPSSSFSSTSRTAAATSHTSILTASTSNTHQTTQSAPSAAGGAGAELVGGPTYQLFTRVGSAMRSAVEKTQAARGIGEGFQLEHVQLLPERSLRRRLVSRPDVADDTSSYYSADDASSIYEDEDEGDNVNRSANANVAGAGAGRRGDKHLNRGYSLPVGDYSDYESDDGASDASGISNDWSESDMTSEYYYTDGDDNSSTRSSRSGRSKSSLFGGLSGRPDILGGIGAASLLAASSILHNDAFDESGFEAAGMFDESGGGNAVLSHHNQHHHHHHAHPHSHPHSHPHPHHEHRSAAAHPRSRRSSISDGAGSSVSDRDSAVLARMGNLSLNDSQSVCSGVKRHRRGPGSDRSSASALSVSSSSYAGDDTDEDSEDGQDDDDDDVITSPAAVRPRIQRHPSGAETPLPSPLPAALMAAMQASARADNGTGPPHPGNENSQSQQQSTS